MEPVKRVAGRMAPLDLADVDTDQIIPKQFLKRIERTGYGPFLFYDWRARGDFVLDRPEYAGAPVLVAGANFGCGSSREHAPSAARIASPPSNDLGPRYHSRIVRTNGRFARREPRIVRTIRRTEGSQTAQGLSIAPSEADPTSRA